MRFLVNVFAKVPGYPLIIASGDGEDFARRAIGGNANIRYVKIDSQAHLDELLANAHLNVMLSFQESGTKLKLVNALYRSRFCVINANMVDDPSLRSLCTMAETEQEFITAVNMLKTTFYEDHERRQMLLSHLLNDAENATKIKQLLG